MNHQRPGTSFRILVTDDLPAIHEDFRKILVPPDPAPVLSDTAAALFGTPVPPPPLTSFTVDSALQGVEALRLVEAALAEGRPYALAFVDMRMPPGWDGIETIRRLWAADASLQVVLCTAYSDYTWNQTVNALGHSDNLIILKKPFDNVEVLQLAHALARKWQLTREHSSRLASLDELVRQRTHALQLAEERFTDAFNASPLAQCIVSLKTSQLLEVNAACEQLMQLDRAAWSGLSLEHFGRGLDPTRWSNLLDRLRRGEAVDEHAFIYQPDSAPPRNFLCSARAITIAGEPCAIWVLRDVTEHLRLEQQLRQSQKLEAVGQLAAGVAHDFNNLLTVIQSYTAFVLDDRSLAEEHRTGLGHVLAASSRAAALTRQLLVFSRRQITQAELIDLPASIGNLRKMLERVLPEQIRVQWTCASSLPPVLADEANLEHVVMNLVVNARDAMPRGGELTISLREVTIDAAHARQHPDARPGNFVCLAVSDTGCGMSPDVQAHIFEPFFTTKEVGKGTGLGLSTVYGIVRQHEGWVEVKSAPNAGSTFEVYFPARTRPTAAAATPASAGVEHLRGRGEHILLVEDNVIVRDVVRTMMTRAGYRITEAADGPSAITAWQAGEQKFDLLLTDMMMPNGYSGTELAARLRQDRPDLRVILTTGYSSELLSDARKQLGEVPIVLKPYTSTSLLEALRTALTAVP